MKKSTKDIPMNALEAEIAITALHATSDYKVLRKINLKQDSRFSNQKSSNTQVGLCLDTETTGLNFAQDKIIELGIVAFEFDPDTAEIIRIIDQYSGFEDPCFPLSAEITAITGISDDMVRGQLFDEAQIDLIANKANMVIAHNAGFDRKFVEARFPSFTKLPWACTVNQINWQAERISTRVLEYLLFKFGWFINAHRALDDAEGLLGVLLEQLPVSKIPVFKSLLETYDVETSKISAVGAPFDKKDILKQRGYRWDDGIQSGCKAWWISVPTSLEKSELSWLSDEVYSGGSTDRIEINRINATDRFSVRDR